MKCKECGHEVKQSLPLVMDRTGKGLNAGNVVVVLGLQRKMNKGILTVEILTPQMVISQMTHDTKTGVGTLTGTYFNGDVHQLEFETYERIPELLKVSDSVGDF